MDDCVEWQGNRDVENYGRVYVNGKLRRAHRVAYCEHHGIPLESIDGFLVRHACDNPPCVNPLHLSLGLDKDNSNDKLKRSREARGEALHNSPLTEKDIVEICRTYVPFSEGFGSEALARQYSVDATTILRIVRGESWSHVSAPRTRTDRRLVGASWHKDNQRWQSRYRGKFLGLFDTAEAAHEAYKEARLADTRKSSQAARGRPMPCEPDRVTGIYTEAS